MSKQAMRQGQTAEGEHAKARAPGRSKRSATELGSRARQGDSGDTRPRRRRAPVEAAASTDERSSALVAAVLAETEKAALERIEGIVVARLVGHDAAGRALVDFPANPAEEPLAARATVALPHDAVGREVAVAFEQGDARRPIVLGLMASVAPPTDRWKVSAGGLERQEDAEQIVLSTGKRLVFRCGKASLVLTPTGKIIVRGEYVLTRATGLNRIQGGSVQIN